MRFALNIDYPAETWPHSPRLPRSTGGSQPSIRRCTDTRISPRSRIWLSSITCGVVHGTPQVHCGEIVTQHGSATLPSNPAAGGVPATVTRSVLRATVDG